MSKKIFLLFLLGMTCLVASAQRHTDQLDRGLVVSKSYNSNYLSWRKLTTEYYDVKYNVYRGTQKIASNLTSTNYTDNNSSESNTYTVAAVINNVEQAKCTPQKMWGYTYLGSAQYNSHLDISLSPVYDRDGNDVTSNYEPNDIEMADLDGDGQLEIIIKRLNTLDASAQTATRNGSEVTECYPDESTQFAVFDAYDVNWQTGAATLMWRIDVGPNMVSLNSTELNIIAYDWDEDGKAEVVLRGADNMIVYGSDGKKQLFTVGDMTANYRDLFSSTDWQYCWTCFGREYLIYMNGQTGEKYQVIDYPLPRLEQSEWPSGITYNDYEALKANSSKTTTYFKKNSGTLHNAWGDNYGHRSSKYFFGAPFLDGRKASLFLGRGIYTRHKMIAMDLDRGSHQWTERWRWNCSNSSSPWYGNGYHNYIIADVDEDGRDEIVYGSMVIDDNGKGLSTTGYEHGDAQHVSDFDPYRKGLEFFGCLEDGPYYGSNYRNATTSDVYFKKTSTGDDGRALMGNFRGDIPGSQGKSASMGDWLNSLKDVTIAGSEYMSVDNRGNVTDPAKWNQHINFRVYWDGDLCSEILDSGGSGGGDASLTKVGTEYGSRMRNLSGKTNNSTKNNACFVGDIIGDWREEVIMRVDESTIRVHTTTYSTDYSFPTLWNDHQYRQAMVWQMMAYNQPPHLSYFLGEMEGITVAPPTLTNDGRIEVANGETITTTTDHLLMCETNDMTVSVEDGAAPYILTVNTPSWVQGTDENGTSGTKVSGNGSVGAINLPEIVTTTYTHTLTGGAFTGKMRLVKQGDGVLELPDVTETYTGETNVWAGTLRFNGTMESSPVWLNRHTRLETDGGTFDGGITADYGATIAVGSEGINVSTLTLNHGARLLIDIDADGTVAPVNVTSLTLNTKTGNVWEQYGPKYLKPVVAFSPQGSLYSGTYLIGHVDNITGDIGNDVVLEGLDASLTYEDGNLYLIVGSGEEASCPEATIAEAGRQRTDDGLLPIVSIDPGTFSYGGSEVMPDVTATFNDTEVELQKITLFSEDFEHTTEVSGWTTSGVPMSIATSDASHGNYFFVNTGQTNTRYAYTRLNGVDVSDTHSYAIEFDLAMQSSNKETLEFCVMSKGGKNPSQTYDNYAAINNYQNMLFDITAPANSTTYTINGTETTTILGSDVWYHFTLNVDRTAGTVSWAISNGSKGVFILPEGTSSDVDGFYLVAARYKSLLRFDNIHIYRTDRFLFPFAEPGTLTVTSSYPSCQWATVTYEVSESDIIKIGDANHDGVVNILDVTATIGHLTNHTPENFIIDAADIDGSGTIDNNDLKAFIRRFGR